ncbi:MAG: Gfo/Idh/MocA family oxidoreductase [Planctomycetota bacterium]
MDSKTRHLKVGMIGTGAMATFYARAIQRHVHDVTLAAVASQSRARAEAFAATIGVNAAHDRHDALFEQDLDAVMIVSASPTHAALIRHAARRRLPTFCDKPLGVTLPEIDAAMEAVKTHDTRLITGFNRRFDPAFRRVHQQVIDGDIGAPESILIVSRDPALPSLQELATPHRLLIGTTIHDLDMARFLMQDEVVAVSTQGGWLSSDTPDAEQLDSSVVSLRFARGGVGTIVNSYRSCEGYDQRLELHGSLGTARVNNAPDDTADARPDDLFFIRRYARSYIEELRCFFDSLRTDRWDPTLATGEDGRIASRLADAAIQAWQGQTIVRLD